MTVNFMQHGDSLWCHLHHINIYMKYETIKFFIQMAKNPCFTSNKKRLCGYPIKQLFERISYSLAWHLCSDWWRFYWFCMLVWSCYLAQVRLIAWLQHCARGCCGAPWGTSQPTSPCSAAPTCERACCVSPAELATQGTAGDSSRSPAIPKAYLIETINFLSLHWIVLLKSIHEKKILFAQILTCE